MAGFMAGNAVPDSHERDRPTASEFQEIIPVYIFGISCQGLRRPLRDGRARRDGGAGPAANGDLGQPADLMDALVACPHLHGDTKARVYPQPHDQQSEYTLT